MPALLGQSGMQTEDGLLTRENTELLREYLADIQRRGQKNLEQQTARCTFLVDTSAMVHRQFPEFMERLKPLLRQNGKRLSSPPASPASCAPAGEPARSWPGRSTRRSGS